MRKHNASKLEDIPNIGKSIASDLRSLGYKTADITLSVVRA